MDLPGFGDSAPLAGNSLGGWVALELAALITRTADEEGYEETEQAVALSP